MNAKRLLLSLLVILALHVQAQDPLRQTKIKLLSKEWLLQKTESEGKVILPATNLPRFRLVLHESEKCEQGLPPDGMIMSAWKLSDDLKSIVFLDSNPQISKSVGYTATIILLSTTQLVLRVTTNNHTSTLYYTLE